MSLDRIETRSLILSAHTVENAEDAYRVESNPKVMQFLGGEYLVRRSFSRAYGSAPQG